MSREAQRPREDPERVMKVLNFWWSEGFRCGVLGRLHPISDDKLKGAERDQFYHGIRAGREARMHGQRD